ncbi:MAG: polysaccharide deacetylase family protein [Candidatus Marinimicrobia bacterium]|nr:polysaccharide deacetylase family protein [Candidatus Neomarinimicrobiota bacterium]
MLIVGVVGCNSKVGQGLVGDNWAEKLGYPKGSKVVILHADDIGMCPEANQAAEPYLLHDNIQSAAAMAPCPNFEEFSEWAMNNPTEDIGLHLTLTSEWQTYRWGPVSEHESVPGLIDPDGYLWHEVGDVASHATAEEIDIEIRAQIDKSIQLGYRPDHIDTHMGTLYARADYAEVYFQAAMDYNIPAMVIEFTPEIVEKFRAQGYPITDEMVEYSNKYTLPKLDDFFSVPSGNTYDEKVSNFYQLIQSLNPGISEIIFHPSVETENLKDITNSWQQRVWEAEMFTDQNVIQFMENEGLIFTNWKEMMERFNERTKN